MTALDDELERSRELARWLVEAGKRPGRRASVGDALSLAEVPAPVRRIGLHRVLLLGVLAGACLQYLYLDAMLQVISLRGLIVFILTGAPG